MYTRGFIKVIVLGACLSIPNAVRAQSLPVPQVISPQSRQVYGWGKSGPSIRIEVRAAPSSSAARYFVTANILTADGQLVERVSLHDDGAHTDVTASDGVFTNVYTLREKGVFQIKARLQQTNTTSAVIREKWSEPVVFFVEQVPYVDITSPNQDAEVASVAKVSASLLIGPMQQSYRPTDSEVRVRCWAEPEVKVLVPDKPSGTFSARIEFPRPGKYCVFMAAQTLRNGQWIESEPDSVCVNVIRPPMWPFWVAGLVVVVAFLWPPKSVWLYRHTLDIHARDGKVHTVDIHPQKLRDVHETVGGRGCTKQIPGAQGEVFTVVAKPGETFLRIRLTDGADWLELRPHPNSIAFATGDWTVYYRECKAAGKAKLPLWSLTLPKGILITLAVVILLYGVWTYWRFA